MGPATKFKSAAGFQQAVMICLDHLEAEEWTSTSSTKTITFSSIKAEEKYSIVVAGLKEWNNTNPFLAS
tara:strand:+ start:65 stop:271 length:207 start_codon:yes stop_codon:yes gene_type:complete